MVEIRQIRSKDYDQWVKLFSGPNSYLEFYKSELDPETIDYTFRRFLDSSVPMWCCVAENDGKLIGFAHYLRHLDTWNVKDRVYLNDLFVSESSRLGGVGRQLIQYVYDDASAQGCFKVYWMTQFENHRAQLLYTKIGKKAGFLVYEGPNLV